MKFLYIKGGRAIQEAQLLFDRVGELPDGGPDKFLLAVLFYTKNSILRLVSYGPENIKLKINEREVFEYGARPVSKNKLIKRLNFINAICLFFKDTVIFRPNHVFCGVDGPFALIVWFTARLVGSKFVLFAHNALALPSTSFSYKISNKFLCKNSDVIVAHGPYVKDEAIRLGGDISSVIEFNNGLDPEHLTLINKLPDRKKYKGLNFTIIYVGRMEESKGVIDLYQAFKKLPASVNIRLKFIGDGSSNEVLKNYIQNDDLADRIELLGLIPYTEVFSHINQASVMVTPSQSKFPEGFCKSAMESLYVGVPVVAPDYGPFPYLIKNEVNGLLYEADNVDALCECLQKLILDEKLLANLEYGAEKSGFELMRPSTSFSRAVELVFQKIVSV